MTFIILLLILITAYCFGAWLWIAYLAWTGQMLPHDRADCLIEARWLGLCGILAIGFTGLLLK